MRYFTTPTSFRLATQALSLQNFDFKPGIEIASLSTSQNPMSAVTVKSGGAWLLGRPSHPNFGHLTLLVLEAVLEVVCVSFPGYVVARQGLFTAEMQMFAANLNVLLFTPCLIFTKLASQLTADTLADLAIIPIIYLVQIALSYICAIVVAKAFGFAKRPRNFVIAMAVFGNSNSLPISLVLSLSQTINGLHWDQVPGDNDNEVAARGILYLLIFQQLGQLLRWSWGLNVLLQRAPADNSEDANVDSYLESGDGPGVDMLPDERQPLLIDTTTDDPQVSNAMRCENGHTDPNESSSNRMQLEREQLRFRSGDQTPITNQNYTSSVSSQATSAEGPPSSHTFGGILSTPANGNLLPIKSNGHITKPPREDNGYTSEDESRSEGDLNGSTIFWRHLRSRFVKIVDWTSGHLRSAFEALPLLVQKGLARIVTGLRAFLIAIWKSMNPPLFAMAAALLVACIPSLQSLFFSDGTFVKNSITSAIRQTGGVAVPLILVVLGANLARISDPDKALRPPSEDDKIEGKLLVASLLSRMVLPTILMAPILALSAKYLNISILDDPIFIIVCFLLAGAPSALQLAQICQINDVYMGAMTRILFHSYVIWILPSTLILVLCALKVVEWATV